jgi:HEAT repeats
LLVVARYSVRAAGIALTILATPWRSDAQVPATPPTTPSPQGAQIKSDGEIPAPRFEVIVKADRLTVKAQRAPISLLLADISRQAGVAIHGSAPLQGLTISINLEDVPLDQGLRHLVADVDAFFFYGSTPERPAWLRAVWVYPKGAGARLEPVPSEMWASTVELEQSLLDPDPEVRAEAMETLVDRKGEKATDAVRQMLSDPDDYVRARALDVAATAGLEIPADQLRTLAAGDPAEEVRRVALRSFAEHPEAKADEVRVFLEGAAQSDQSELVRSEAAEILRGLSESAPRQRPKP